MHWFGMSVCIFPEIVLALRPVCIFHGAYLKEDIRFSFCVPA